MNLILRAVFREYKPSGLRHFAHSLAWSLAYPVIVVELFSYLFQSPAASPQAVIPYTQNCAHQRVFTNQ